MAELRPTSGITLADINSLRGATTADVRRQAALDRQNLGNRDHEFSHRLRISFPAFGHSAMEYAAFGKNILTNVWEHKKEIPANMLAGAVIGGASKEAAKAGLAFLGLSSWGTSLGGIAFIGAVGGAATGAAREAGRQYTEKTGEAFTSRKNLKNKFKILNPEYKKEVGKAALRGMAFGAGGALFGQVALGAFEALGVDKWAGEQLAKVGQADILKDFRDMVINGIKEHQQSPGISPTAAQNLDPDLDLEAEAGTGENGPADPNSAPPISPEQPAQPFIAAAVESPTSTPTSTPTETPTSTATTTSTPTATRTLTPTATQTPTTTVFASPSPSPDLSTPVPTATLTPLPAIDPPAPPVSPTPIEVTSSLGSATFNEEPLLPPSPPAIGGEIHINPETTITFPPDAEEWVKEIITNPKHGEYAVMVQSEVGRLYFGEESYRVDKAVDAALAGMGKTRASVDPITIATMRDQIQGLLEQQANTVYNSRLESAIKAHSSFLDLRLEGRAALDHWYSSEEAHLEMMAEARKAYDVKMEINQQKINLIRELNLPITDVNGRPVEVTPEEGFLQFLPNPTDPTRDLDNLAVSLVVNYDTLVNTWWLTNNSNDYFPAYLGEIYYLLDLAKNGDDEAYERLVSIFRMKYNLPVHFVRMDILPGIPQEAKTQVMNRLRELYLP